MKKRISTFLITMIGTSLYSQRGFACNLFSQCMRGIPNYNHPFLNGETDELFVTITAENAKGKYLDNTTFTGNVDISHGKSRLQAEQVLLRQNQQSCSENPVYTVNAIGNVHYENNQIILKAQKAWSNLSTKDINVWKGDYQFVGRQGRGRAALIKQRDKNRYTILKNGSFTSCLPGSDSWSIAGSKVIHDHKEQIARIWNARFKLGSVPVFYSPYFQMPVGNKRLSGFLSPNAKYSIKEHFDLNLPYYWNIAPNMDATITPSYNYKRNNIMWKSELRYLTEVGLGLMEFYYLPFSKIFKYRSLTEGDSHCWLYHWKHSGVLNQVLRSNINYTKVNNPRYFNELSSKYRFSVDNYTPQKFSINYTTKDLDLAVSKNQFQVLSGEALSYATNPQLDMNWFNDLGVFDMRIYGQVVHFINANSDMPQAIRIHFEPSINLPWSSNWGSLNTEVKLMGTHYQQKNLDNYNAKNNTSLEKVVNRTLPQFKIQGKLIFERDTHLSGYIQTLEPRIQYLWRPYRVQNKINNYDSSLLQSDYNGLFRDRIYSGFDRIPSTNQMTTGITSRVCDNNAIERFNLSLGQIYYFTGSRTGNTTFNWKNDRKTGSLMWASDSYWHITDHWHLRGSLQYDIRLDGLTSSNAALEYLRNEDRMVQLTYRYASPRYLQATEPNSNIEKQYYQGLSQIGGIASWSIANRLSLVGAYYFDTNTHKMADQKLGMQYNSCCYAIRFSYERKFNGLNISNNQNEYDNVIGLNIYLRGLSSNYDLGTQQMLDSSILPYRSFF